MVGMWEVVDYVPAKVKSKNRDAGVIEPKSLSLDSEVYLDFMTKEGGVLDILHRKCGDWMDEMIIQQDNATPHWGKGVDAAIRAAGELLNILFKDQSSQSPDSNKLDLCLFNSLQKESDHIRANGKTIPLLIESVKTAWIDYDSNLLVRAEALSLEICRQVLDHGGCNQYKLPHSGINKRQRNGENVCDYTISATLVNKARNELDRLRLLL